MELFEREAPAAARKLVRRARNPHHDFAFDDEKLAWFDQAPVEKLAAWRYDMLDADDDMGCRSKASRQLERIIKQRGITDEQLIAARPPFRYEAAPAEET